MKECLTTHPHQNCKPFTPADNQRKRPRNKVLQRPLARVQIWQLSKKNETTKISNKTVLDLATLIPVQNPIQL